MPALADLESFVDSAASIHDPDLRNRIICRLSRNDYEAQVALLLSITPKLRAFGMRFFEPCWEELQHLQLNGSLILQCVAAASRVIPSPEVQAFSLLTDVILVYGNGGFAAANVIPMFMRLPSLLKLRADGFTWTGEVDNWECEAKTSNVCDLHLPYCDLSTAALIRLIRMCRALRAFRYNRDNEYKRIAHSQSLDFNDITEALHSHSASLERLTFESYSAGGHDGVGGPLTGLDRFVNMKYLEVDTNSLFGTPAHGELELLYRLPPGLEVLHFHGFDTMDAVDFFMEVAETVTALPTLKRVEAYPGEVLHRQHVAVLRRVFKQLTFELGVERKIGMNTEECATCAKSSDCLPKGSPIWW